MSISTLTRCSSTPSAETLVMADGSTRRNARSSSNGDSSGDRLPGSARDARIVADHAHGDDAGEHGQHRAHDGIATSRRIAWLNWLPTITSMASRR
jgi:hypothetical protein